MKTTVVQYLSQISQAALRPVALGALLLAMLGTPGSAIGQGDTLPTNAPPDRLSYQGYLVDANGNPLAPNLPANYTVVFRIYLCPSGNCGPSVWSEQQVVTVDKGNFSVVLGEGSPYLSEFRPRLSTVLNSPDASSRYIGTTVTINGTPTEILPRLRLLPTPYAFLATSARNLTAANGANAVTHTNNRVEVTGNLFASGSISGDGSGLTGVKVRAADITSGPLAASLLPSNVALTGNSNNFATDQSITGNLHIGGKLGIGGSWSSVPLYVEGFTPVTLSDGGQAAFGNASINLAIDDSKIQARSFGREGILGLNPHGGTVLIGDVSRNGRLGINKWFADVTATIRAVTNDNYALSIVGSDGTTTLFDFATNGVARKPGGGSWSATSDSRLKSVLGPFQHGLNDILKLDPVRYHYREGNARKLDPTPRYSGFVAQDVQKVIPEAVTADRDGYLQLSLDPIYLASINAIKELHQLVQEKDARIAALETQTAKLKGVEAQLASLREQLALQQQASAAWEVRFGELEKALSANTTGAPKKLTVSVGQ